MSPFIIPISILFLLVFMVVVYGYIHGGVEKMLENEIQHNDINASKRLETARFIDFFRQVKRVDSLYINEQTNTIQFKKNNRLSDHFNISRIKIVELFFNSKSVITVHQLDKLPLSHETIAFESGDLALMIDANETVLNIIFDGFENYQSFVEYFMNSDLYSNSTDK